MTPFWCLQTTEMGVLVVSWGCRHKPPQTSGFKQQKLILTQFWGLEVQNQGAGGAMLPVNSPGQNPSLPLAVSSSPWPSFA